MDDVKSGRKNFNINLGRLSNGRDADYPDKAEFILDGFALTNKYLFGEEGNPTPFNNPCLILAFKRELLRDYASYDPELTGGSTNYRITFYTDLATFDDGAYLDENVQDYCGIVIESAEQ